MAHFEASQAARMMAENSTRTIEEMLIKQQLTSVRDWLCSTKVSNDQERHSEVRSSSVNYGKWLLKRQEMTSWMNPASRQIPLLWLHGIPGAGALTLFSCSSRQIFIEIMKCLTDLGAIHIGKTILASFIIERIQNITNIQVAFFYCKHADPSRSTFLSIAKSMLIQLLCQNKSLLSYLYEKSSRSGESCLETKALAKDLLITALKSMDNVFIVIDGLDECEREDKCAIISWFKAIVDTSAESDLGGIRALLISQDDGEIRRLLNPAPELQIKSDDNLEDIQSYTTYKAIGLQKKFDLSTTMIGEISSKVCARAEGEEGSQSIIV